MATANRAFRLLCCGTKARSAYWFGIVDPILTSAPESSNVLPSNLAERPMSNRYDQIIEMLARYRRLKAQINDKQALEAADLLIEKLEAEKLALRTEE